jgi:hypothetical protein
MSQHKIDLPSNLPLGRAGVVCGYDRWPTGHFFCNVCVSLNSDDLDEPLWASILDQDFMHVSSPDGFDAKLATYGITLPDAYKLELRADWSNKSMSREAVWSSDGRMIRASE